ncbi:MAG: kinase [Acidobacteria bacterium]|nr:MAG: kinase [Acidobacteriota bacterium]PYQ22248.1 MAG: kinase [Acidobacteriota bacterium]
MEPPELAILVGLPGAGKTSFVRSRLAGHVHVSKDLMRHARNRNERQLALVAQALAARRSLVVDNTNLRVADRAPLIAAARAAGARVVGYFFDATAKECLERNRSREGRARVPDVAIHIARARLELPARGEGFDALFIVRAEAGEFQVR